MTLDERATALSDWANAAFEARENYTRDPHEQIERLITAGDAALAAFSAPPPADPRQAQIAVLERLRAEVWDRELDATEDFSEAIDEMLAALRAPGAVGVTANQRQVKLGVVEFHRPGLAERFYSVVDDLRESGSTVDVWLMDIATVLREFGYTMTITAPLRAPGAADAD